MKSCTRVCISKDMLESMHHISLFLHMTTNDKSYCVTNMLDKPHAINI